MGPWSHRHVDTLHHSFVCCLNEAFLFFLLIAIKEPKEQSGKVIEGTNAEPIRTLQPRTSHVKKERSPLHTSAGYSFTFLSPWRIPLILHSLCHIRNHLAICIYKGFIQWIWYLSLKMTSSENNGPNFINNSCLQKIGSICDWMLCIMSSLKQAAELESVLHSGFCSLFLLCLPKESILKCLSIT